MGLCPRKAGLSLGPRLVPPPTQEWSCQPGHPDLPPASYEWKPHPHPLEASWTKELGCQQADTSLQDAVDAGQPGSTWLQCTPNWGGGVDSHVKISVVNRCMAGSYF